LLRNDVKYLPLDTISRICGYLIDQGIAAPEELPGALFAIEPESFWELLARRTSLQICLGTRRDPGSDYVDDSWVVTADSLLLGVLLNGVSTLGGTARYYPKGEAPPAAAQGVTRTAPHPEEYVQWLVLAPQQNNQNQFPEKARRVYDAFEASSKDKALVALGSVKSNPVIELMLARAFRAEPFVSQDDVLYARERACPVYLRFRENLDVAVPSFSGGQRLSQHEDSSAPGIYYERADGTWEHAPWTAEDQDAALIFYHYLPAHGRLEMVIGGFSSRSTRLLAQVLTPALTSRLWPPVYDTPERQIGIYVVKFKFTPEDPAQRDILAMKYSGDFEIISLEREVITRRLSES